MNYSLDDNEITNSENYHHCHHVVFNLLDAHINQKTQYFCNLYRRRDNSELYFAKSKYGILCVFLAQQIVFDSG